MMRLHDGSAWRHGSRTAMLVLGACIVLGSCKPDGPTGPIDDPSNPGDADTFSVTLEWDAPTEDAEGNPLADLVGYRLHYRNASPANGTGASTVELDDTITRATVTDLAAGQWFFGVTARDVAGNESALSNEVRVEVGP